MTPAAQAALLRLVVGAGQSVHDERRRRGWTLEVTAQRAGLAISVVHRIEAGETASLESYARLGAALGRRPELSLVDDRARPSRGLGDAEDYVHAAMGEVEASALTRPGRTIAIDEPYQYYQFAGRGDVLAWQDRDLLHIENRTEFPNIQDAAGSYNAKRQYLARSLAERLAIGPRPWRSVTHVMACLWTSEVLHVLRMRNATFTALCPDGRDQFDAWLAGAAPEPVVTSSLVVLDPLVPFGSRKRTVASLADVRRLDARYRNYAEAADALRRTSGDLAAPRASWARGDGVATFRKD